MSRMIGRSWLRTAPPAPYGQRTCVSRHRRGAPHKCAPCCPSARDTDQFSRALSSSESDSQGVSITADGTKSPSRLSADSGIRASTGRCMLLLAPKDAYLPPFSGGILTLGIGENSVHQFYRSGRPRFRARPTRRIVAGASPQSSQAVRRSGHRASVA